MGEIVMTVRKNIAFMLSLFLSGAVFSSGAAISLAAEKTDDQVDVVLDNYGPNTDEFELLEKLDIDTTTHYRSAVEDMDREVYIYSGVSKSSGIRETYKAVLRPSCITFKVKSEASEEELLKILRKYFDDTNDDHLLITPVQHHETLGIDSYGVSRSDSKDLIDYQLAETVYEDIKAYADVVLFLYSPSYLQLQHCFAGDLEYDVDDYDVIAAYVKDNGLPFKVEIAESELGKTKTIVRIENKKETEPIVLREAIYKTTGIWGSTPVYYDEGIVNEPKSIDFATFKVGDISNDDIIDVTDLTELSLALLGDKELTADQQKAADVDGDGEVTIADLARLQQYLSKKIDKL